MSTELNDRSPRKPKNIGAFRASEEIGIETFFSEILTQFQGQIRDSLPTFRDAIIHAGRSFLKDSRRDLERWTRLLAAGSISQEEFHWLVQARVHLAEMDSLLVAGLTLARIDELRGTLISAITGAAFDLVGI